ncbi:hypothetical protein HanRHA438_Chr11g0508821 [Helianthus annuus]|nr:hypothetical protein HanRHA438_Chr11g0508821 [Helianthus annuus]
MDHNYIYDHEWVYIRVNCHFRPCGLVTLAISVHFSKMRHFPPRRSEKVPFQSKNHNPVKSVSK